jgi:ArsR family transcriptional regulator
MARMRATKGLPNRVVRRAADLMRVLGHPVRFKLVELLLAEELAVGELAAMTGQPQNVVSRHLKDLHAAGVLSRAKRGRGVYYRVVSPTGSRLIRTVHHAYQINLTFEGGEAI